jgi:hypothetical protein
MTRRQHNRSEELTKQLSCAQKLCVQHLLSEAQATQTADPLDRRLQPPHQGRDDHRARDRAPVLALAAVDHHPLPIRDGRREGAELLFHLPPRRRPHTAEAVHGDLSKKTMLPLCMLLVLLLFLLFLFIAEPFSDMY